MCSIQDRDNEAGARVLGHLVRVARSEEWIRFFAAPSRRAFSWDAIAGTVIMHKGPTAFDWGNGAIFCRSMDHGPASPNRLAGTFRLGGLILWAVIGEGIQPRVPMTFRHWSQKIVSIAMPSPVSPPAQGEQTAEENDKRSNDAPDDGPNSGPAEP